MKIQKIVPCLWFDDKAEEAVNFYVSLFKNSKVIREQRYDKASSEAAGKPVGSVMVIEFEIEGQRFMAMNGGPMFKFSEAISFVVNCDTQEEVDRFWEKLSEGGKPNQCGWITDKYGVTWQIVPTLLDKLLADKDREKAERVMKAMLDMHKIESSLLQKAYDGN